MRRAVLFAFVCVAFVSVAGPTLAAAVAADECVMIVSNGQDTGIDFEVKNNCDRALTCSLGWTVTCENASGKITSTAKSGASFGLAASNAHHAFGSAKSCKDGWHIDDVTWDCQPASK